MGRSATKDSCGVRAHHPCRACHVQCAHARLHKRMRTCGCVCVCTHKCVCVRVCAFPRWRSALHRVSSLPPVGRIALPLITLPFAREGACVRVPVASASTAPSGSISEPSTPIFWPFLPSSIRETRACARRVANSGTACRYLVVVVVTTTMTMMTMTTIVITMMIIMAVIMMCQHDASS